MEIKVGKRTFQWCVDAGNFGTMRYTMILNEKGDWFEIGEMSQDGQAWRKFFEMSLQKSPSLTLIIERFAEGGPYLVCQP